MHPSVNSPALCGANISASATAPTITGLTNGQPYVIAIAAYDEVDNIGPLSVLQCSTPAPTIGFFNQYCADGGQGCGGCGSCAVGADNGLLYPGLAAGALAAVGLLVRREERRRKRKTRRPHPSEPT